MIQDSASSVSGAFLLGLLFVGLKLTDVIVWSWWWVTAPFWGPFLLLILFFGIGYVVAYIAVLREESQRKSARQKRGTTRHEK